MQRRSFLTMLGLSPLLLKAPKVVSELPVEPKAIEPVKIIPTKEPIIFPSDPEPFPGITRVAMTMKEMGDGRTLGEWYTYPDKEPLGKILKLRLLDSKFYLVRYVDGKRFVHLPGSEGFKYLRNKINDPPKDWHKVGFEILCWHKTGPIKIFINDYNLLSAFTLFPYKAFKLGNTTIKTKYGTFAKPRIII